MTYLSYAGNGLKGRRDRGGDGGEKEQDNHLSLFLLF